MAEYENGTVYELEYQGNDSDEDTEDASETESMKHEYDDYDQPHHLKSHHPSLEIKEQIYRDKLAQFKEQLEQLDNECHPDLLRGLENLRQTFDERRFFIHCCFKWQQERIQHDYVVEEQASVQEFNDRRIELKENLIADLEEKKRLFEADTLELTFDTTEPKPTTTRKLRRRPNDPIPMPDRRRRASPAQINYMLDESEINDDLKQIAKFSSGSKSASKSSTSNLPGYDYDSCLIEARISDGKLFYDKRWYHRGQHVLLESMDGSKSQVLILQIGSNEIWCRKQNETLKTKVTLSDLHYKKYILHKRS